MKHTLNFLLILSFFFLGSQITAQGQKNAEIIELLINESLKNNPTMAQDIHSIVISQLGEPLYSQYFNQFTADSLNNLKSITKSMIGLLIGIAVEEGYIQDVNQPMINFFSDCQLEEGQYEDKKSITIKNLLQMQSGIEWDNGALIKDQWWFNESPHCFLLREFKMDTIPGAKFSYNSAVAHLLSGIISRSTGKSTLEFAIDHIFEPLNIKAYRWDKDHQGEYYGNSELYLKPTDLLLIGQMLLNNGVHNGKQIVAKHWIKEIQDNAFDANSVMNYGYLWMTSKTKTPYFFFAGGSGGQHLFIAPEKNIVLVTTAHWNNARSTMEIMQLGAKLINEL
uniref:serine hydrolase domain-containing protein n=1 Tax=Fulvivirga sp. TaxID=1931237 RepID=UPI00404A64B5